MPEQIDEAEKRVWFGQLSKPPGLTEDDRVKLASTAVQRTVRNGPTEVQICRFPNLLRSDIIYGGAILRAAGRAISRPGRLTPISSVSLLPPPQPTTRRRLSGR